MIFSKFRHIFSMILATSALLTVGAAAAEEPAEVPRTCHRALYQTTHNGVFHFIQDHFIHLTLEDGSEWSLSFSNGYLANQWSSDHYIVIAPKRWNYDFYDYRLINQTTGETIDADLWTTPSSKNSYFATASTHCLQWVNYETQQVVLDDNSIWMIADSKVLNGWRPDDIVIIGINDGAHVFPYANVLINGRTKKHVLAYCFGWL